MSLTVSLVRMLAMQSCGSEGKVQILHIAPYNLTLECFKKCLTVFSRKDCAAYLARPKKTGTGGCMRRTSRIKFFKSGISFKASLLNSWPFDITVIISVFILSLYSFSNIYNLAIHVRNAPDTPP